MIPTDGSRTVRRSRITASGIYDGEVADRTLPELEPEQTQLCTEPMAPLTARLSPPVRVHERLPVQAVLHTLAGETVLDIGQNQAGIFRLQVHGVPTGQQVRLQFCEVLQDCNFYRGNLGSARAEYLWTSNGQDACLQPHFTFYGYHYVKVEGFPDLRPEDFTALALYSDVEPVGSLSTGHPLLNPLISNVRWGQKSNFIDIPTDCPQRDERMGWTGDAQVFCPTASYFTDATVFYRKYLYDLSQEQKRLNGMVPNAIPSAGESQDRSAAWGDAICILPWTLYQFPILEEQYPSMAAWVEYIVEDTALGKICRVPAGQYAVTYRALRPLGKVYHTDALLIDLQHNPATAACLKHYLPQAMKAHGWNKFRPLSDWMTEQGIQPPAGLAEALTQIPRN